MNEAMTYSMTHRPSHGPFAAPVPPATPEEEEGLPCMLWVDAQGQILDCCEHAQAMFGYHREELKGRHISLLLPGLADTELMRAGDVNPRLGFRCRCATPFRAVRRDGGESGCTLFVNLVALPAGRALAVSVRRLPG